jgi:hypothetical protein
MIKPAASASTGERQLQMDGRVRLPIGVIVAPRRAAASRTRGSAASCCSSRAQTRGGGAWRSSVDAVWRMLRRSVITARQASHVAAWASNAARDVASMSPSSQSRTSS